MATEALALEVHKKFAFRLEINGYPVAAIQECKLGAVEVGVASRAGGGQNFPVHEGGMIKYDMLTCKGVVPLDGPGKTYWQKWINKVQDPTSGTGMRKREYAQDFTLYDLDPDKNVILAWEYHNGWVTKFDPGDRNAMSEKDDTTVDVTIVFDYRILREV